MFVYQLVMCSVGTERGKDSLMGWVMASIYRKRSCGTQATFLCQDVCERMRSLYCAINTPFISLQCLNWYAIVWSCILYCGKSCGSASQWKPFWTKYLGTAVILWHKVMNASCRGLMFGNWLTERGENVSDYSSWVVLLHPIIKQTGAPLANQRQVEVSSSQSNAEPSDHSKQGHRVCKHLGGSLLHQNSWYLWLQMKLKPNYNINISKISTVCSVPIFCMHEIPEWPSNHAHIMKNWNILILNLLFHTEFKKFDDYIYY